MKIEKGIKIPATYGQYSKYPFGEMKVGDSFKIESTSDAQSVRQAAIHHARRSKTGMKFSVRKFEDHHRCWRVK